MEKRDIRLKNSQGKSLTLQLRQYRDGDEEGMISCIRDEYGDTYFKQSLYDPEYIRQEAKEGNITFLVAESQSDGIIGMMMLKQFYPRESMCEIASQIFRKKYRGLGLAMPFFEYGMKVLLSRPYSAAFCLPVLFHNMTQKLLYRQGLRATGFVLNVFDMNGISHSYWNGRNCKHSMGIQIKAMGKTDAGSLYLPQEHQSFGRKIYDSLGVRYRIAETSPDQVKEFLAHSDIAWQNEKRQHSLEICISRVGADLKQQILALHAQYPLRGNQTAVIFLNCNDPHAVWAYNTLKEMGYFFTGFKPLCSADEYMVLHRAGEVKIYFDDYIVSEEFARLLAYVKKCYEAGM